MVTITGANLIGSDGEPAQVQFDGVTGTDETVSPDGTYLTVLMPPHDQGPVNVDVLTHDGGVTFLQGYDCYDGPVGSVNGMLWIDFKFDGLWEEGEPKLPNTPLTLERTADLSVGITSATAPDGGVQAFDSGVNSVSLMSTFWLGQTDANGQYNIPSLPYGHYVLHYTLSSSPSHVMRRASSAFQVSSVESTNL